MNKKVLSAAGLLAAGLVAGSAFSITAAANAADENATTVASTNSVATDTTSPSATDLNGLSFGTEDGDNDGDRPDVMGPNSVKDGESLVTGDALQTLTDAALAKYPGATIIRVEKDSDGATYEVHLKKADGGVVTVEFDANFAVTGTHNGFANGTDGGPSWNHDGKAFGQSHGQDDSDDNDDDQGDDAGTFTLNG